MVLVVVLKLQLISDGVMTSHSVGDGGSGLISTVTESVGGVYTVDEGSPYCNIGGEKLYHQSFWKEYFTLFQVITSTKWKMII